MNRFAAMALCSLLLFAMPALAAADSPVLLLNLPESAQMIESVEFDNGDFIQTYQLEGGVSVQLLRYSGFAMTIDELIASDWPLSSGIEMQEITEISGYPAQHAKIRQAVDAQGYAVKADGKESGVQDIDLVLVDVDGTMLIYQSIMESGTNADVVASILSSLQVQGGENAEVG